MAEQLFADRYQVTEKIGGGGMAEVYKAADSVLGRTVAVKVLHPQFARDENFVARFRQEAQAAANLSHPNIVNIYDWGQQDSTYYIIMEFVEGKNLKEIINAQGPLSPKKTMDVTKQVASALDFAHRRNVIHRDIKPHNIIITPQGEVKVMDFGIARAGADTSLTQTGSILGTAQYISPEQAQGRAVGAGTDIYSLGVVMYEMLTGDPPFTGENPVSVAVKQVNDEPVAPTRINPAIPRELEAIVLRAMAKRPEDRYPTAEDMREDIERLEEGAPTEAMAAAAGATTVMAPISPPPTSRAAAKPPTGKKTWPWVLAALGVMLLAALAIWAVSAFVVPQTITVPNVVGRTEASARQLLDRRGLEMATTSEFSETVPKGRVVSQDPEAGATVRVESFVNVVVSRGKEIVEVPNVSGQTLEDATAQLEAQGLVVGKVTREFNPDVTEGVVIRQAPSAGERVAKGDDIDLVVSRGTQTATVPNVVGRTTSQARVALGNAGLKMNVADEQNSDEPAGTVLSQDPSAGTNLPVNSTVSVVVSAGPPMVTMPNVKGKTEAAATNQLEALGLVVQVDSVPDESTNVVKQSPAAGTKLEEGSTVKIYVGDGSLAPEPGP
ncbi:MAG: Stk1 family PASTA domain-containing Ser/Thr kinase [Actinobacteria bacterium]|nr:MAG: Stk1 family PASTA domain-containing Ser/Thr kinase [Actinomycetota bacterium]